MKVTFPYDHDNPTDSQLLLALTRTPDTIKQQLIEIIRQMERPYGKPLQGTVSGCGYRKTVITPVWNNKPH